MTYRALMYLACEQMVTRVKQLPRKKWARQPINKICTRTRQPMDILCVGVKLPMEDLCLRVRHLPLEDLCVGVRQLQLEDTNQS